MHRLSDFNLYYEINNTEINSSHALSQERDLNENQQSLHYNYTTEDLYRPYKTIPIMSVKYIFIYFNNIWRKKIPFYFKNNQLCIILVIIEYYRQIVSQINYVFTIISINVAFF